MDTKKHKPARSAKGKRSQRERAHIWSVADGDRQYVLHPADDELFTRTGLQVIEACRLNISIEVWLAEFYAMLDFVSRWVAENRRISQCFAVPCGLGTGLFMVPLSESFDFDLADALAELNRQLVQKYNIGSVEVHQVPAAELDRFIIKDAALQVYPNAKRSPRSVEA